MVKKCICVCALIMLLIGCLTCISNAAGTEASDVIKGMSSVQNADTSGGTSSGIGLAINVIIGAIQYAGTGIALIMVTILGMKYMLAAPADKANVKQQIAPIMIGCVLLFGAIAISEAIEQLKKDSVGKIK